MSNKYLEKLVQPEQDVNNLFRFLQIGIISMSDEWAEFSLPARPEFLQGGKVIAGGIIATLADEAMAHIVLTGLPDGAMASTIEMNIRYLRPVSEGELKVMARLVRRGRNIVTTSAEVFDDQERLLATAGASFAISAAQKPASKN